MNTLPAYIWHEGAREMADVDGWDGLVCRGVACERWILCSQAMPPHLCVHCSRWADTRRCFPVLSSPSYSGVQFGVAVIDRLPNGRPSLTRARKQAKSGVAQAIPIVSRNNVTTTWTGLSGSCSAYMMDRHWTAETPNSAEFTETDTEEHRPIILRLARVPQTSRREDRLRPYVLRRASSSASSIAERMNGEPGIRG